MKSGVNPVFGNQGFGGGLAVGGFIVDVRAPKSMFVCQISAMTANDLPTVISSLSSFFDDWLAVQLSKTPTPGIQVAIRVGDELAYSRAFGLANAQTGEALTTAHRFRVASHSKTFTATAILVLAEQGKLRLDDTLATWILELDDAPAGQEIGRAHV